MINSRLKELIARKERRDRRRWTYRDIEGATGLTTRTISEYATNKITRYDKSTLTRLIDFFGCEVGDLLVYEQSEADEQRHAADPGDNQRDYSDMIAPQ